MNRFPTKETWPCKLYNHTCCRKYSNFLQSYPVYVHFLGHLSEHQSPNCSLAHFFTQPLCQMFRQDKQLLSYAAPGMTRSLYSVYLCLNNIWRLKRGGCWEGFQDDKMERTDTKHENTRTLHIPTHWLRPDISFPSGSFFLSFFASASTTDDMIQIIHCVICKSFR